jgi:hypothetical protein
VNGPGVNVSVSTAVGVGVEVDSMTSAVAVASILGDKESGCGVGELAACEKGSEAHAAISNKEINEQR